MDWDFFIRVSMKYILHYLPQSFSRYRIHDAHKTGSDGQRRSVEILDFIEKYGTRDSSELFRAVFPHVAEIRRLRRKVGARFGKWVFCVKHPMLLVTFGRSLNTALDMY
jgi:hypothetical protein